MGISEFGEMRRLSKMARPDICVITNIGLCHLENLGDRDGILKAKTEMFEYKMPDATIILNGDDDKLITVKDWEGYAPLYFGLSENQDIYADEIQSRSLKGTECTLHMDEETLKVMIPIPGHHMVYNAMAGALVGRELGLTAEEIQVGIESLVPVSGRNNLIETENFMIIDDCYNANPISTKASLDVLATADTRKVAILGDMFELGENEKAMHYDVGAYAAQKGIDFVICIGELSKETTKGVAGGKGTVIHFDTKEAFFEKSKNLLQKGDAVLVKASHGMAFAEIVDVLKDMEI
jgi:UDP-N-acetylmuramoyl-tripeptide--D-alanyl-D-alanine ligase